MRYVRWLYLIALSLLAAACGPIRDTSKPPATLTLAAPAPAHRLVVVLPGRADDLAALKASGMAASIQQQWPDADVTLVELTLGYYESGKAMAYLHDEVVEPARHKGYREIWLLGASMGGMGTMLYDTTYPNQLTGLILLAPCVGDRDIQQQIHQAGGIVQWQAPPATTPNAKNWQIQMWRRIGEWSRQPEVARRVWLAYGDKDKLAPTMPALAAALPPDHVITGPGEHAWTTWTALTARVLKLAGPATRATMPAPTLTFEHGDMQDLYGKAYRMALDNALEINRVDADAAHRRSGLLQGEPAQMVRAGGGYPAAWTRDASINSWNALSLIAPGLARNTLLAVIDPDGDGYIVRQDNQQWDQAIWVVAAWRHYLATGDEAFLRIAYDTSRRTLALHRSKAWDKTSGLFLGPSSINDGISGYPEPISDATESHGAYVGNYPLSAHVAALSTNAVHYEAYADAAQMGRALQRPAGEIAALQAQADALKRAINRHFWNTRTGGYSYLYWPAHRKIDAFDSQEGLGWSFAILFGIAGDARSNALIGKAKLAPWGIEDVYPAFARYNDEHPGRHNNTVWPMTSGFWGSALAAHGHTAQLGEVLRTQAQLALRSGNFQEIYNAQTGQVDGGWQVGHAWTSERDQTWSATAYLRLIYTGVFGIHPTVDGLRLAPQLPAGIGPVTLSGLRYRDGELSIALHGDGHRVASCRFDGAPCPALIPPSIAGKHRVDIELSH
ncbi:serine aminopeptidase domain-containing protein [Dyella sp.]|uniref:serine aminopeptidase domain-containing protein n=1 Tax=Dyella sp. TaxID=1869338 RepID=UPI002ED58802